VAAENFDFIAGMTDHWRGAGTPDVAVTDWDLSKRYSVNVGRRPRIAIDRSRRVVIQGVAVYASDRPVVLDTGERYEQ
jgi:hypothetical protein